MIETNKIQEIIDILLHKLPIELCHKIVYENKVLSTPSAKCMHQLYKKINQCMLEKPALIYHHICYPPYNNHPFKTKEIVQILFIKNCYNKRLLVGYHDPKPHGKVSSPGIKYYLFHNLTEKDLF
jgi:hypothetical protein